MTECLNLTFQLANLETKWQHLEQNNFVMKECILHNTHNTYFLLFIDILYVFVSKL